MIIKIINYSLSIIKVRKEKIKNVKNENICL